MSDVPNVSTRTSDVRCFHRQRRSGAHACRSHGTELEEEPMPGDHELTHDPQLTTPPVVEHSRSGEFRRRDVLIAAAVGGCLAGGVATLPASQPAHSAPIEHPALGPVADLARWDENGYRRFRAPALTQTENGTLLAAFDGRPDMGDLPTAGIGAL